MIALISDFDGTIWFDGGFKNTDLKAIKTFQEAGNLFGLCTGRALSGITKNLKRNNITFDFLITSSGAVILEGNNNCILHETVDYKTATKVFEIIKDLPCVFSLSDQNYFYYRSKSLFTGSDIKKFEDISEVYSDGFTTMAISFEEENSVVLKTQARLLEVLGDEIEVYQNTKSLDIVRKGCGKGNAIKILQRYYGLKDDELNVIGDSYNDIPMFDVVKNSFTFINSPDRVKKEATYYIDSVAEAIKFIENNYCNPK